MHKRRLYFTLLLIAILFWQFSPSFSYSAPPDGKPIATVNLRLLETTDLHVYLANYDYYQAKEDNKVGLVKTATLIKQAGMKQKILFCLIRGTICRAIL
ncbi:hypothetical protein RCG23_07470 [Neobacillus sp. PS3-34]|uniref:hypothetical protein n=1 Tax=Neobacillus sp. PS3-34 TaxID=3070678 RepID=UPI0027DFE705|nr:hypothetical protein [Neobacillus sp. PS3-34]WML49770.1 hypothetical protein RCG23_07470 [Neobacillus sp. PS3-34]